MSTNILHHGPDNKFQHIMGRKIRQVYTVTLETGINIGKSTVLLTKMAFLRVQLTYRILQDMYYKICTTHE